MSAKRAILQINEDLCNGCGQCVLDCAEGAIRIVDGKAKIVSDSFCDGLGACIGGCPTGALTITEREAAPFDEEAAMAHVASERERQWKEADAEESGCACAGHGHKHHKHGECGHKHHGHEGHGHHAHAGKHAELVPGGITPAPMRHGGCPGAQAQGAPWPVKLRLIPPEAPFLKGADLVIAADCAAPVVQGFYERYAKGAIVLIGCPKFEDNGALKDKLEAIFRTAKPRSCTVLRMEVPCCAGIVRAAKEAYEAAGGGFFWRELVLSRKGEVVG